MDDSTHVAIQGGTAAPTSIDLRWSAGIDLVQFDESETLAVVAGNDGWVSAYELPSGKRRFEIPGQGSGIDIWVSPHGKWVAVGRRGNRLDVIETRTGVSAQTLSLPATAAWETPWQVAFDANEIYGALGSTEGALLISDLVKKYSWRDDHQGTIGKIVFDNGSRWMAVEEWSDGKHGRNSVYLTDLARRSTREVFRHLDNPIGIAFSWDGSWFASRGREGTVAVGLTTSPTLQAYPTGDAISSVAFRPHSHELLLGGDKGMLRIVNLDNNAKREVRRNNPVERVLFAGAGSLIITQEKGSGIFALEAERFGELGMVRDASVSELLDEGRVEASLSPDSTVIVDLQNRNRIFGYEAAETVNAAAITSDGEHVAIASGEKSQQVIQLFSTLNFKRAWAIGDSMPKIMLFDTTGQRLAVTPDRLPMAEIVGTDTGRSFDIEVPDAFYSLNDFSFCSDNKHVLLAALLGPIRLTTLTDDPHPWQVFEEAEGAGPLYHGVFSKDGSLFAAVSAFQLSVRATANPSKVLLRKRGETFHNACFSYDNKSVVALDVSATRVFQISDGASFNVPFGDSTRSNVAVACSPIAPVAAVATTGVLQFISAVNGDVIFEAARRFQPVGSSVQSGRLQGCGYWAE